MQLHFPGCAWFSQQRFRRVFQQSQTTFCCQTVFDVFGSCMLFLKFLDEFLEKFVNANGRKMFWSEFTQNSLNQVARV